ncbi:MAG TPA: hypothetical protein VEL73_03430 [Mycobacteriales bacterium]|nr:hypothetical protein [Mycobacteriales bacterium]
MLAIRAAHLFDGVSSSLLEQPLVLVEDGRVLAVQTGGAAPAEAAVVDLVGATLLPGLIDAHPSSGLRRQHGPGGAVSAVFRGGQQVR